MVVIGALAMFLFNALNATRDDIEEASVQAVVLSTRTQLMEVVAHRETYGGQLPASDNPMDWVAAKPANYLGAVDHAPEEKSVWYYDKTAKILIYQFRNDRVARFQLSRAARAAGTQGVISGIGLIRLDQ